MLRHLAIRDMLLIARQDLDFGAGLNVLTGETGAGKSILLDCLGFVLGWRGRAELVRQGAAQGEVEAVFELSADHPARAVLSDAGLPQEGDELILRRVNVADGRKTGFVNDRRVSGEVLRALSDTLVELHGQHDDRGLLNPRGHRLLLDAYAGLDLGSVRAAWAARRDAMAALDAADAALEQARADEDFLRHAVAELDKFAPLPGEEEDLDTRRRAMQGAEKIGTDVARAGEALGPSGAEGTMLDALRWLEGAADRAEGRLDAPIDALGRAMVELGEASGGVEDALEALRFDPAELEATEERLFALRALARKHDVPADALGDHAEALRVRLQRIDSGDADRVRLAADVAAAEAVYDAAAREVRASRTEAASRLDRDMAAELAPLKMERAVFATLVSNAAPGPEGADMVAFTVATNPGAPSGPLDRIASGGELSRFLLALKVCLARSNVGVTLIFDEIDRGVGGATADAVGRRLSRLAEGQQVLVVTHSPQVAALGAHHFRVMKDVADGMTTTRVAALDQSQRQEEVARMLAGETITPEARAAAQALLRA